ncbi:hypothetical protein ILFOPFJJ_06651 [Ensifer psoraleae]|uniref:hypothetical protein n=1 Tax=Sinorhizobium TaxID=28105 RepID=UPI001569FC3F|nr:MULTISPECIES: hypothetical protein [Sinorhizobium]MDK1389970.1 hypothetical protein [Sinorhizobium sp. 7-81]NRP75728.1 hypothetical protein [Sinorhizobium psoraleae]
MSRENVAFVCSVAAGVALLFIIGLSRPDLLVEDHLVESLGALGFATAALLALGTAIRRRACLSSTEKSILAGTSGLCSILFLSEISFGARMFNLQMPEMRGGGEFDGGHDIVIVAFRLVRDSGPIGYLAAAIGALLLLTLATVLLHMFRQKIYAMLHRILARAFECRLALAVAMLASAVTLDLVPSYKAGILEEVLEFGASGVLILAIIAFRRERGSKVVAHPPPGSFLSRDQNARDFQALGLARERFRSGTKPCDPASRAGAAR